MPVNLSTENAPDDVARGFHNRAASNQRSPEEELKQAATDQGS